LDPPILPRPSHWGPTTLICCADALVDIRRWGRRVGAPTAVAGIWNSDVNCWDLPALWSIHIALDNLTLFNIFYNRVNLEPFHGFHGFHGMFFLTKNPSKIHGNFRRGLQPRHQDPSFLSLLIHGSNDPPGQGLEPLGWESDEKKYIKNPRLPSWGGWCPEILPCFDQICFVKLQWTWMAGQIEIFLWIYMDLLSSKL
jgi:hypothetical protein